jgi:precorrin-2 dehydrogenase/sirohydrochlorin ferrochelatase
VSFSYPINLDVSRRTAVIVGGGAVAARKARGLFDAGCRSVRVVAPTFDAAIPAGVERIAREFQLGDLNGASLVFAATDSPQVNETVANEAHRLGALVCRVDHDVETEADFSNPAVSRSGALMISVAASGSPALAASVRDQLAAALNPAWTKLADCLQTLRPIVFDCYGLDTPQRSAVLRDLSGDEAMRILQSGGAAGLCEWICGKHPQLKAVESKLRSALGAQ